MLGAFVFQRPERGRRQPRHQGGPKLTPKPLGRPREGQALNRQANDQLNGRAPFERSRRGASATWGALSAMLWAAVAGGPAQACQVRAGFSELAPSIQGADPATLPPGAGLNAKPNTQALLGLTCLRRDSPWALDLSISRRHSLQLQGEAAWAGRGALGELQLLPLTVTGQYRAAPVWGHWRPFAGAGWLYLHPLRAQAYASWSGAWGGGTGKSLDLRTDDRWAPLMQLGLSYDYTERAYFELGFSQSRWSQTLESPSGQRLRLDLRSTGFNTTAGWRF
jgi:outer membrane protein W